MLTLQIYISYIRAKSEGITDVITLPFATEAKYIYLQKESSYTSKLWL